MKETGLMEKEMERDFYMKMDFFTKGNGKMEWDLWNNEKEED